MTDEVLSTDEALILSMHAVSEGLIKFEELNLSRLLGWDDARTDAAYDSLVKRGFVKKEEADDDG